MATASVKLLRSEHLHGTSLVPSYEQINAEHSGEYIAWIREQVGPVLEEAKQMLQERYPGTEMGRSSVTVKQLRSTFAVA